MLSKCTILYGKTEEGSSQLKGLLLGDSHQSLVLHELSSVNLSNETVKGSVIICESWIGDDVCTHLSGLITILVTFACSCGLVQAKNVNSHLLRL